MVKFVFIFLLVLGCAPDQNEILDSFAFITAGGYFGSGFAVSNNLVLTACHVIKDPNKTEIKIENIKGDVTYARKWKCDSKLDIAYLLIEENIFEDFLTIKSLPSGVMEYGCFTGVCENRKSVCTRCRTMHFHDERIVFLGGSAIGGMSGGPCVVKRFGETFVVGVEYYSYYGYNHDPGEFTNWGGAVCANLRASDLWGSEISWD